VTDVLFLKNLVFTILVPGTVAGLVPYMILAASSRPMLRDAGALRYTGLALLLLGGALYFACILGFARHGRGTPAPIDPPRTLVARGPYRFSRNPMDTAVITVILGEAALFASGRLLAYGLVVLTGFHLFVVLYEEPTLGRLFGPAYDTYCTEVPRWLPVMKAPRR
jgi:protein-S-isoprenylcysteine O-methyltransferase Ste14